MGVVSCPPFKKPGMFCRKATVTSTPPTEAIEPISTTASAKNIKQPGMKSVATTERYPPTSV